MTEAEGSLDLTSRSAAQTRRLGERLGELLQPGDVVLLEGEFGAGKTVFAQGIARGLGVTEYVTSPSFTLVNEHRGRGGVTVYHIDLYRLEDPREAVDLGLLDVLAGEGVCLVEWAERVRDLVGDEYLLARLSVMGINRRSLHFEAKGPRHSGLLGRFAAAGAGL
ncbi:MAG: tRNA (adenosine(37)-N6)-threonylcarbamoyltransferase complex ATPase subunit type 1 TsaE [Chloroflexi bacterium]|nr:tRNA (adenosine(37)-N6)-threonylcarbamoyltransferase complex ATPase subunit type 1 TsaE [Chloroflexota bacterium]MCL5110542.1 tRNA (adenosine(37)-N6)-threonylcarbamoyltransferase complex ATPase subunit type 1 TsaE [Chloroflexota bacterium]